MTFAGKIVRGCSTSAINATWDRGNAKWDRGVAVALAVLMLATYSLWFVPGDFPRIGEFKPLIHILGQTPRFVVPMVSTVVLMGCGIIASGIAAQRRRWLWLLIAIGLAIQFALDTLTLQPWAYQAFLYAVLFACLRPGPTTWHRTLAISIYVWSAISKLDYQFAHSVGADMVSRLSFGWSESLPQQTQTGLALGLPIFEMLVAAALAIPKTRLAGQIGATILHVSLIVILGPWAAGHSTGVLLWNAALCIQVWTLWHRGQPKPSESDSSAAERRPSGDYQPVTHSLACVLTLIAVLAPAGERREWWDHWTAWAVYAPHTGRVQIQMHTGAVDDAPAWTRGHWRSSSQDPWQTLDLASATLKQRGVPVYPQRRYQRQLAKHIALQSHPGTAIRMIEILPTDRWTGRREWQQHVGEWSILEAP